VIAVPVIAVPVIVTAVTAPVPAAIGRLQSSRTRFIRFMAFRRRAFVVDSGLVGPGGGLGVLGKHSKIR
jgi:hypothetical protein